MSVETVDPETGEVISSAVVQYDPRAYLATLTERGGLDVQRKLAAAYDSACAALIGPNDVQQEKGRTFKKKSAWRKLARYFNISVVISKVEREYLDADDARHFLATVTAKAVAPWGQSYEEVGACCTDEATGRRTITVADAIATAATRASNRAVSNLIAMGEVSAEEIGERGVEEEPEAPSLSMPIDFGKKWRGKFVKDFTYKELEWALESPKSGERQRIPPKWRVVFREEMDRRESPEETVEPHSDGIAGAPDDSEETPF